MKPKTITRNDIEELLSPLPQYYSVAFALYCCDDVKEEITDEASIKVIELTKLWLSSNGTAITQEELRDAAVSAVSASYASYAASAAHAAASAASASAAHAASSTAYYAASASAAHAASSTAYYAASASAAASASYASYAASASASYAAASASASYAADASGNSESKLRQYYDYALSMIADMTELEKILYGVQG